MTDFTTLPIEDLYESTLQSDLGETDLIAKTVKLITGTLTGGRTCYMGINYDRPSKYELVEINAINGQDVTIVTRALPTKAGGTGLAQNHPAGSKVIITHNYKVFEDIATAIASKADGTPSLDGTGAVYANSTARDAAIPSPQNNQIVMTAGVLQYYSGGAWVDTGTGTATPNASTTVAGKVEIPLQAENDAGTRVGGTGAILTASPDIQAVTTQNNKWTYAGTTAGSSTAYTATVTPAPTAYVAGQEFTVLIDETNGASPTINFNSLGAKNIVDASGTNIAANELPAGALVSLKYNGTAFQLMSLTLKANSADANVYTSSTTWTKPTNAKLVYVECYGAGGGGGGGQANSSGSNRPGGNGGGGGSKTSAWFRASELPSSVTVTVGTGGTAGTGGVGSPSDGNPGGAGGTTSFGSLLSAYGGSGGAGSNLSSGGRGAGSASATTPTAIAGTNGIAGQGAATVTSGAGDSAEFGGGGGGVRSVNNNTGGTGGSSLFGSPGGGGGGGCSSTNLNGTGGAGGAYQSYTAGGGGAANTAGTSRSGFASGDGGGGGTGNALGTGNAGGAGGAPGAGGGGGGAGTTGGAGGAGGRGEVRVYVYY